MNGDTIRLRREAAELNQRVHLPKRARMESDDGRHRCGVVRK